jgi:glycolate oxidase FAD binding subunit
MAPGELSTRLRSLLGPGADLGIAEDGVPVVRPRDEASCALLLRTASLEGWRVRVAGAGTWMPPDGDVDLALSTTGLTALGPVSAADLVATAQTGIRWDALRSGLADAGAWLAHDAPGGDRTLGSLLATASAGPLRAGYGPLRDHVLGLTLITGDGRITRVGGRVVKNVAGYDVAKLAVGSFGAFGVITTVHLRLRAVPRADVTLVAAGSRDALLDAARSVLDQGFSPAALELLSPAAAAADEWALGVRLCGTEVEVAAERAGVHEASRLAFVERTGPAAAEFWQQLLGGVGRAPVTARLGALPASLEDALDLVALHLDEPVRDWISVTVPAGTVRWSGRATGEALARFRTSAAAREWPVTLERAPAELRARIGVFGSYREGSARLVAGLKAAFDPAGVLVTPLGTGA